MQAVFFSNNSALKPIFETQSLPYRETLSLRIFDFDPIPQFSLEINNQSQKLFLHEEDKTIPIHRVITLSFPTFPKIEEASQNNYYQASWQASYLAFIEMLYPQVFPIANSADWIQSFALSFANRHQLATVLEVNFASSYIINREYSPTSNHVAYDLTNNTLIPANQTDPINGYFEIFSDTQLHQFFSAVVLDDACWISKFSDGNFSPHFSGSISGLNKSVLQTFLKNAVNEWGLANLIYFEKPAGIFLVQVRFDIANLVHPQFHISFSNALLQHLSTQ